MSMAKRPVFVNPPRPKADLATRHRVGELAEHRNWVFGGAGCPFLKGHGGGVHGCECGVSTKVGQGSRPR